MWCTHATKNNKNKKEGLCLLVGAKNILFHDSVQLEKIGVWPTLTCVPDCVVVSSLFHAPPLNHKQLTPHRLTKKLRSAVFSL